jgi:hypothetical protein
MSYQDCSVKELNEETYATYRKSSKRQVQKFLKLNKSGDVPQGRALHRAMKKFGTEKSKVKFDNSPPGSCEYCRSGLTRVWRDQHKFNRMSLGQKINEVLLDKRSCIPI